MDYDILTLYNENWTTPYQRISGLLMSDIIICSNINSELYTLLETGLEFVSFTATTVEGKTITITK